MGSKMELKGTIKNTLQDSFCDCRARFLHYIGPGHFTGIWVGNAGDAHVSDVRMSQQDTFQFSRRHLVNDECINYVNITRYNN